MKRRCVLLRFSKLMILGLILLLQAGLISAQSTSPLCFTARNGSVTVRFDIKNVTHTIQYSTDSSTWNIYTSNTNVTINANQSIYFRAASNQTSAIAFGGDSLDVSSRFYFTSTNGGTVEGSGNIMSLYGPDCPNLSLWARTFSYLFYDCTLLTAAPSLPATTLATYCYWCMFKGCTLLLVAPSLPATTLAGWCYGSMFSGCTSLTAAPSLPATTFTLAYSCCVSMFSGCTSLTEAPSLPATTLVNNCYSYMFQGCTSLTAAPSLPATTLVNSCYCGMFQGCTSLTAAPLLPATTLADFCYDGMFKGCTSLTEAPSLPATTLANFCYNSMFSGCTSLTEAPLLPATTLAGWCYGSMFSGCTSLTAAPSLPATTLVNGCYSSMFQGCTSLTEAPSLPATTLVNRCYSYMFQGCTSLTAAPSLPATTLVDGCYSGMFKGCTSLTVAPSLPATTLADWCYSVMFFGCTSLTVAPSVPATTLANYCYYGMFHGCTSLTSAPSLPATTLADACYEFMFKNCTSLTSIPSLPATTLSEWCYGFMFDSCTSLVVNMVPSGQPWTISVTATAPNALDYMFLDTRGTMNGTPSINTTYYIVPAYSVAANVNDTSMGCVTGTGIYHQGDVAILTATPTNHYHFARWSDGNTQNPRNLTVARDTSYVAIFEIDKHVVSSNHNFVRGTGKYDYGTTVTLTAPSGEHHRFVRWGDGSTDSVCSFVLDGDTTVIAIYDIDSFIIAAMCLHGIVEGGGKYAWADVVSLSVSVDQGYRFVQWSDGNEYNPRIFVAEENLMIEAICEEVTEVGVDDMGENNISFYWTGNTIYNPYNELIRIYTTGGKLIRESNENIEMEGWPAGVYVVVDNRGNSMKVITNHKY